MSYGNNCIIFRAIPAIFCALITWSDVFGQSDEIQFSRYTTLEGLSENYVNCIFQDSRGFIWIGTNDGLNRFDGYNFKIYRFRPDHPQGISSNLILSLAEDKKGNLWIGTTNEGISQLDVEKEQFTHYKNTDDFPHRITKNSARSMLIDHNDNIWFGNAIGLNFIKKQPLQSESEPPWFAEKTVFGEGVNDVRTLVTDGKNIWAGGRLGLFLFNTDIDQTPLPAVPLELTDRRRNQNNLVMGAVPLDDGLIVAYGHGIYRYKFTDASRSAGVFSRISYLFCNTILLDKDGVLWCGNNEGLYKLILSKNKSSIIKTTQYTSSEGENSLGNNVITSLFQDKSGLIWIGTNGSGVSVLNTNKKKFRHYTNTEDAGSISANIVRSIYEDGDHNLYIGTNRGVLNFLPDVANNNYQTGFKRFGLHVVPGDYQEIYCFAETTDKARQKTIWIGAGFPRTMTSIPYHELVKGDQTFKTHDMPDNQIHALLLDKENNLWAGTYLGGLYRISGIGQKQEFTHFSAGGKDAIGSNIIRSIHEDMFGNLWFGTGNGLSKLPKEEKLKHNPRIITYTHRLQDSTSLSHNYILPIYESITGQIWVGTMGGGLNKVIKGDKADNDTFVSYGTKDGFPNDVIKGILEDDRGNLWVSSNKGISKFNPATGDIKNYDIFDGLQDFEFMELAACKRHDGEMLFGGINGFNAFYPDQIVDDTSRVKIVLTDFQLSHQSVGVGESVNGNVVLERSITATSQIFLSHDQNSFAITFAALHYAAPMKNQYAYKLEGFDEQWIKVNADNRIAKYTNLGSGDYIFKVKATNNDGIWTNIPKSLHIAIAKPIYLTAGAWLIYAFLFLAFLWFLRQYSIIRNNKKNELLMARFEKEKLDELTRLKFTFFTNISHEFKTPLALIIGYHEKLQKSWGTLSKTKIKTDLDIINRNANVLLRLINQLMDFRKLEQGKMTIMAEKDNITEFIAQIQESFQVLLTRKRISASFKASDEDILLYFDKDKMEKIIYNLLSNAVKYTPEGGTIETIISREEDQVVIKITDTGIGIPGEMQRHLFERFYQGSAFRHTLAGNLSGTGIGLSLSKELVEIQGGTINFTSKEGSGTCFYLTFPRGTAHLKKDQILNPDQQSATVVEKTRLTYEDVLPIGTPTREKAIEQVKTNLKILIVDDNVEIRNLVSDGLAADFMTVEAQNGATAFDICLAEHPDLIVSDIMMPVMDGYELCHKIKNDHRTSHIPIILLTAKDSAEGRIRGYTEGADGYIGKPFNLKELNVHIQSVIDSRNKIRQRFREKIKIDPDELAISNLDKKFMVQITRYVESNLSEPGLSVEQLVNHFKISGVTLNKKLKSLTGKTANSFIRSMRLKRAMHLLRNEPLTVSEVTYKVGFNDLKYFRECFKKEYDINPSEYRRKVTN